MPVTKPRRIVAPLLAVFALIAAGCSDGDSGTSDTADGKSTTTESAGTGSPLLVDTTLGPVQGTDSAVEGVRSFLAIPFAAPPTG